MARKYWKDSYEYRRILEILDAYWLEEEDEAFVSVLMHFRHKDGQKQDKYITWVNPQGGYKKTPSVTDKYYDEFGFIGAATLMSIPESEALLGQISHHFELENPTAETYAAMLQVLEEMKNAFPEEAVKGMTMFFKHKYGPKDEQ